MVSFEDFMNDKRPIEEISSSVTFRLSSGTGKDTKSEEITFTYNQSHGVVHTADDILIAGYSELDENGDLVVDKVVSMPSIRRNFLLGEIMEQLSKGAAQESIIQELRGGHIRGQNEEIQFKPSVSSDEEDRNKKTRDFLFGENGYLESIWNNNPLINGEDKKRKAANRAVELSPKEEELLIKNSSFSMINILFFDEGRKRFVDNFFNAPDVSPTRREQSNKKKFTTELFLFDAIFLAIFF